MMSCDCVRDSRCSAGAGERVILEIRQCALYVMCGENVKPNWLTPRVITCGSSVYRIHVADRTRHLSTWERSGMC